MPLVYFPKTTFANVYCQLALKSRHRKEDFQSFVTYGTSIISVTTLGQMP